MPELEQKNKIILAAIGAVLTGNNSKTAMISNIKNITAAQLRNDSLSVSLKLYDPNVNCLSRLLKEELQEFSRFCVFIRTFHSPSQIDGTQYCCRITENHDPVSAEFVKKIKDCGFDVVQSDMHHYKLSETARIHGVWKDNRFKLVWIDPDHMLHDS